MGPLLGEKPPQYHDGAGGGGRDTGARPARDGALDRVHARHQGERRRHSGSLFSGEKVLVIATGNVEAGVDLGDLDKDDVSVNGETVTIDLPEARDPLRQPRRGEDPASTIETSAP